MSEKTLTMNFLNEQGKKFSLRVDGVKDDIKNEDITQVMNNIIAKNIFATNGGDLKIKDSAQITEKNVNKIQVK